MRSWLRLKWRDKMTDKEIYQEIVKQDCGCIGIRCVECPFNRKITDTCDLGRRGGVEYCKQKLKEIEMNEMNEIPELVGKKMLVSNNNGNSAEQWVFGRLPNGCLVTSEDALCRIPVYTGVWTHAKPLLETVEVTIGGVKGNISKESAEELKRMFNK